MCDSRTRHELSKTFWCELSAVMTETFFETLTKQTNDLFSAKNKQKVMIKIGFTPLADCNILPFLKGFLNNGNNGKNYNIYVLRLFLRRCRSQITDYPIFANKLCLSEGAYTFLIHNKIT